MRVPGTSGGAVWGKAVAALHRARRFSWVDLFVAIALAGLLYGFVELASQWTAPQLRVVLARMTGTDPEDYRKHNNHDLARMIEDEEHAIRTPA